MHPQYTPMALSHFWSRVDRSNPDGCWEWQASRLPAGYGHVRWQGRHTYAHRVAWEITNGPIPTRSHVCHHCDNPPCCRPDHLYAGTASTNAQDRTARGRNRQPTAYLLGQSCPRGHPLTTATLVRYRSGQPRCRLCQRAWRATSYARGR